MNRFFLLMLVAEVFAALSQMLLKISALKEHKNVLSEYLNAHVITGYVLLGISMLLAIYCYRYAGYLWVVVLEPMSYILVMVFAAVMFKEKITRRSLLGMLLIIGGIAVFNL